MPEGQLPDNVEHVFTREDREAQLADLESLCSRIADAFASHNDSRAADLFRDRADFASRLLAQGFTQADLNELGGGFPDGAWWLNPKGLDYSARREPWQDEVARLHELARSAAGDLRAIATLYPR
jgi:hypothetical protein